jgi:cytochrome P450
METLQPGTQRYLAECRLRDDLTLVPRAIDELIRWETPGPFSTPRVAVESIDYGGTVLPAGSTVLLAIAAANRDPRRYERPDEIDIDRPPGQHLGFGLGAHYCPGSSLARLELDVALTALISRFPRMKLAIPAADLAWRGNHTYRRLAALPIELAVRRGTQLGQGRSA